MPHIRLTFVAQKRLCLSSLSSTDTLCQLHYIVRVSGVDFIYFLPYSSSLFLFFFFQTHRAVKPDMGRWLTAGISNGSNNQWWVPSHLPQLGTLRSDEGDRNDNVTKAMGLLTKTTFLHVHNAFFYTFLCRHCTTTTWKCLISRYTEKLHTRRLPNFLRASEFEYGC